MSLLAHVVDWLVPFICGGVATVLGLMWRWGKAMVNGLRELLLCQLEDLRREMVIEHDGVATRTSNHAPNASTTAITAWAATATGHRSTMTSNPRR